MVTCQNTEDSRISCRGVCYRKRYYTRGLSQYLHDNSFAPSAVLSSKPKCGVCLENGFIETKREIPSRVTRVFFRVFYTTFEINFYVCEKVGFDFS